MLERVVMFDGLSVTQRSKPFDSEHLRVSQEFLDTNTFPEERSPTGYILFEFGETFFLNANSTEQHHRILKRAVPRDSEERIVRSVENRSGLFFGDLGIGNVNPYAQAMMNLRGLLDKFESEKQERIKEFNVARLFFQQNRKKREICRELGITRAKVEKIVRKFSYRSGNQLNFHTNRKRSSLRILLANVGMLMKLLRRTSFRLKSLEQQLAKVRTKAPELEHVGLKSYSTFVKTYLGLKYRRFERSYKDPDKKEVLKVRKSVAFTLAKLFDRDCVVIFFDSTSVCDGSFKRFMWTLNSQGRTQINKKKVYGYVNLFMATTAERILNFWIATSVNAVTTASFLFETIRYCRNTLGYRKIVVFMDNARIHSTKLMKDLAAKMKVYFLLNAPYSSKINQVEYVFELVKRPFRNRNDKTNRLGLSRFLRNRMLEIGDLRLTHQTSRFWKYLLYAMKKKKFWDKNK